MFFSSEYLRYKQNMERMRAKVKEREEMRKELEIKFKKLMKERNECEKTANVHKSKYDFLLEQERKRLIRNTEMLQMLENIDSDGMTGTRTERMELFQTEPTDRTSPMNRWRRNYQQLSSPNELPSRQMRVPSHRRSASATRPFAYACPSSAAATLSPSSVRDIENESIVSSENNKNNNQFSISSVSPPATVRHQDNRNFMMNYNPIHLRRQIMPLSSSVYRLSTTAPTTTHPQRPSHLHYGNGNVDDGHDDDDADLTASISTIVPVNNKIISHRNSNAITPSALSTYRHYPIVRRPLNDLLLQPAYWKRNAETQTTNENASLTPATVRTPHHQTYYTNRYSQQSEPRYQPSTLSRYRSYYDDIDGRPLASNAPITSSTGTFDRTNPFGNLANSTLPSWRSATELYKLPHDIQTSTATNAIENLSRPTYYLPLSTATENVNQPRIHYQNQTNQFSFINEAAMQQQQQRQQQQQPYSGVSASLEPQPQASAFALRGDGLPYHSMTSTLPSTGVAMDGTNVPSFKINSHADVGDGGLRAPFVRDAANGLPATQQSNDRWPGQPTVSSVADSVTTAAATDKWIESRERNDYANNQMYEYAESDPDKSKINELVAASSPNDKWSGQNNNFQRQQIQAQVAQLADTQDPPVYVSAELNLPYRATVYDYPPTSQQIQQTATSPLPSAYAEPTQQPARRRLSHDNYTASKSDDDLMMAKKKANGNEKRRYSVATHLYDYQQNYPKSEPILLPSATAARPAPTNDWNANETLLSRYTSDDNVNEYSTETSAPETVRYDDGGGAGGGGLIDDVTQYVGQPRSERSNSFIENQMQKLALDEPQRDVETENAADRNYSPNGKYSKTVTWADDPQMNFKREVETTPTYDSNQTSDYRGVADTGETSQRDSNQQQQQQQQQLYQYENESYATETNAPIQYSVSDDANVDLQPSDGGDQSQNYYYGDGNYGDSTTTTAATAGTAVDPQTGAYYDQSGQQAYQDQYYYEDGQNQPLQQQPQQQQYAPNDGNEQRRYSDAQQDPNQSYYQDQQQYVQDADTARYPQQQPYADGYQYTNYPEPSSAVEPQDAYYQQSDSNYYQTEPGVNYYGTESSAIDPNYQAATEYTAADYDQSQLTSDSRQYTDGSEVARLDDDNNSSMANYQSTSYGAALQQPASAARSDKIPNYLQSDTEDSQSSAIGAGTATARANTQSHVQAAPDSDFDFSTNS